MAKQAAKKPKTSTASKTPSTAGTASPESQLSGFIARFTPEIAALGTACVDEMRAKYPQAVVLVYDNYNALAVGFGPNERATEAIFSLAFYPNRISLCFLQAGRAEIRDPEKLLQGSGSLNRFIPLTDATMIHQPAIAALMEQAIAAAATPFDAKAKGHIVIKSISDNQRPRRPAAGSTRSTSKIASMSAARNTVAGVKITGRKKGTAGSSAPARKHAH